MLTLMVSILATVAALNMVTVGLVLVGVYMGMATTSVVVIWQCIASTCAPNSLFVKIALLITIVPLGAAIGAMLVNLGCRLVDQHTHKE